MARPTKMGLDYFPYDCNTDRKVKILVRKYGLQGEGFYLNLLKMIYANGYYIELCDDSIEDLSIEFDIDLNDINEMIDFMVLKGFFSKELYENSKVLTSNGIQKRFLEATKRRKELNKCNIYRVNVDNNPVQVGLPPTITPLSEIDVDISTQSKVKKSKEEKRKEKELAILNDFNSWWDAYDYKSSSKADALKKWKRMNDKQRAKCLEVVADYVKSTPDKQFRKGAGNYLSGECWENEIIATKEEGTGQWDTDWEFRRKILKSF